MYIHIHMYLPIPPHEQDVTQGQFLRRAKNRFSFRIFLLLDWLPY